MDEMYKAHIWGCSRPLFSGVFIDRGLSPASIQRSKLVCKTKEHALRIYAFTSRYVCHYLGRSLPAQPVNSGMPQLDGFHCSEFAIEINNVL